MQALEVKRVSLPVQEWQRFACAYSADLLMEAGADKVGGVRCHEFEGFLYTVMSISYLGSKRHNLLEAWQLVPEKMFTGEVFDNRCWETQVEMGRRRGDFKGYKVRVKGKTMICTKEVCFIAVAPTVSPLSLHDAQEADDLHRRYGWRAQFFGNVIPSWKFHNGHPVAIYENGGQRNLVLMWRNGKKIEELMLPWDTVLDPSEKVYIPAARNFANTPVQVNLF